MLNKIPTILSPDLVKTLMEMGHGDTIVLADGKQVIRADGHYERAKEAFAVVATGETAIYANILLKKGVVIPKKGR